MVFAHPFRLRQTVCFIGHTKHLSFLVCDLNSHVQSERCFGLGLTLCPHPHSGWFIVSLVSRVRLPKGLRGGDACVAPTLVIVGDMTVRGRARSGGYLSVSRWVQAA